MHIDLDKDDLKQGVMGLVMALVEIIRDTLQTQSLKRMEGGTLSPVQIEKLGEALMKLDEAIEKIKTDNGISETVKQMRDDLDNLVGDVVEAICEPARSALMPVVNNQPHSGVEGEGTLPAPIMDRRVR